MKKSILIITLCVALGLGSVATISALATNRLLPKPEINSEEEAEKYITDVAKTDEEYGVPEVVIYPSGVMARYEQEDGSVIEIREVTEAKIVHESYSPSGKYAKADRVENSYDIYVEIRNGGSVERKEFKSGLVRSVVDVKWVDDETVWVIMHVNPSLQELLIYHCGGETESVYGCFFTLDSDGKMYYVDPAPHFSTEWAPDDILDHEENILYRTSEGESIIRDFVVTDNYFVFYVGRLENEDCKLVVLDRNDLSTVMEIERPAYGEIVIK